MKGHAKVGESSPEDRSGNDAADALAVAGALLQSSNACERRRALDRLNLARRAQAMMLGIMSAAIRMLHIGAVAAQPRASFCVAPCRVMTKTDIDV